MSDLSQLLVGESRAKTVSNLTSFVEQAISQQSGMTGMALKGGVGAAKKVRPDVIPRGVDRMLPELLGEMQPYWQEFRASGSEDFGVFLEPKSEEVSDSLLQIADRNVEKVNVGALTKIYQSLRGRAGKLVRPQVPELGRVLQRLMP